MEEVRTIRRRPRVGEHLVEKAREVRAGKGRPVQVASVQPGRVTLAKRKAFLDALAATCNVAGAARAAMIDVSYVYTLRRREPVFAELWEQALEIGYQRLETQLLGRALEALADVGIDPDAAPVPPVPPLPSLAEANALAPAEDTASGRGHRVVGGAGAGGAARGLPMPYQLALAVLGRRDAVREKGPRKGLVKRMDAQTVDALLARKLDALAARNARAKAGAEAIVAAQSAGDAGGDPA